MSTLHINIFKTIKGSDCTVQFYTQVFFIIFLNLGSYVQNLPICFMMSITDDDLIKQIGKFVHKSLNLEI